MAQLKVKQISDFVSAVEAKVNGIVGTANVSAISVAKSEAISSANSGDVVVLSSAKSYADQAEADAVVTAAADASTKASAAQSTAISTAVSADVVLKGQLEGYADTAEADALSNAKVYADSKDVIVLADAKTYSDIQKSRIDALLLNSSEALDTFAEISTFITSLETGDVEGLSAALSTSVSNDAVHASGISANATAISNLDTSAQGYADTAEANAIAAAEAKDVVRAEAAKSYADGLSVNYDAAGDADTAEANAIAAAEAKDVVRAAAANAYAESLAGNYDAAGDADTAEANAIAAAKTYTDGRETAITTAYQSYADTAEADAIASANSHTDTEIAALDSRIDGLEGASFEEVVANFVDITGFSSGVQFNLDNVKVFVNGLQIHEAADGIDGWRSANGIDFTVEGLGYDLESDDHIIVSGRLA